MKLFSIFIVFTVAQGLERRVNFTKNPGCSPYRMSLYHLEAMGPNDTLHYLWDFTEKPTIFLSVTDVNDDLNLNCLGFVDGIPHSLNFTKNPKYEFFLIFNKLIEFNDINDTGILTPETPQVVYDTKDIMWTVSDEAKNYDHHKFISLTMKGIGLSGSQSTFSGNLTIQLTTFGFENHDGELPRLLHSANSTQCKVILDNLSSESGFNKSRYAIEFILISRDSSNSTSKIVSRKNLDDENSPGIFSMVDVMTPKAQAQLFEGAFLQWRPIIYTSKIPSIANSSETVVYNLTKVTNPDEVLNRSLPFKYYGYNMDSLLIEQTIVSMGVAEDGFYRNTNYTSWTFLINYGSPEDEKFSLLIILVMCIGLGLPALLILTGGTYMCARRIRRSKDELSLGR